MRGKRFEKQVEWRERMRRFEVAQGTVAEFCALEGVSTAALYQWRRRLGGRPTPQRRMRRRSGRRQGGNGLTLEVQPSPRGTNRVFQQLLVSPVAMIVARLPGGVELEWPGTSADVARAIVGELLRVGHGLEVGPVRPALESEGRPC